MYPSKDARELSVLLRISRDIDIVGDVTATVDNRAELLAWASILSDAEIIAWRSTDSGHRYLSVTADRHTAPIRGLCRRPGPTCPPHHRRPTAQAKPVAGLPHETRPLATGPGQRCPYSVPPAVAMAARHSDHQPTFSSALPARTLRRHHAADPKNTDPPQRPRLPPARHTGRTPVLPESASSRLSLIRLHVLRLAWCINRFLAWARETAGEASRLGP